jgi:uncharacterized repeat protein (TIGR03837 family)
MQWDVFCRVVDNFGDIGVCWRLACDLAARGIQVRLWVDDPSALTWMAPGGAPGVEVLLWNGEVAPVEPGDAVVEVFGCHPPPAFVARMRRARPPVWINVEYLSAEPYVERTHALPSPQFAGPGAGLMKWFFYPGFTVRTGGLIREPQLLEAQRIFEREHWFEVHGIAPRQHERVVSLFCYDNPALPALLDTLATVPTLLLVTPDMAARQMHAALGPTLQRGALRAQMLPYLSQADFDRLLWACDLNFVRGEDSFVRAQWAARPFVWHIYPQEHDAHAIKMDAFLSRYLEGVEAPLASAVRALWFAWIGRAPWPDRWPAPQAWSELAQRWQRSLSTQHDLTTALIGLVAEKG